MKALLLALFLACAPFAQGETPSQTSSAGKIAIKALPFPGEWVNSPKDFKILSDDSFSITASKETDLYNGLGSPKVATAPMLLFPAAETFVLTTAVTADFEKEYDGGFLVVYADAEHWVKLLFERSHYGPLSVCSGVTNGETDDSVNADVTGEQVFLRLTREKDVFGLYYSLDGKKWAYVRYFRFPVKGPLKVGFASQSPAGEQATTVFSKVRYAPRKVGDFWSGEPEADSAK